MQKFCLETICNKFLTFVLKYIDEGDNSDKLTDIFVRLLLSINLHFPGK